MVFTYLVSVKGVQTNFRFSGLNFAKVLFLIKKIYIYFISYIYLEMKFSTNDMTVRPDIGDVNLKPFSSWIRTLLKIVSATSLHYISCMYIQRILTKVYFAKFVENGFQWSSFVKINTKFHQIFLEILNFLNKTLLLIFILFFIYAVVMIHFLISILHKNIQKIYLNYPFRKIW